jgi:phosphatidylserine decarboxylase
VGWVASSRQRNIKTWFINWAIKRYGVDMSQAAEPNPNAYASFNDFFTRALKVGARPIAGEFCSPADGEVSQLGPVENDKLIQAKGVNYRLDQLLGKTDVSAYKNGSFVTIYLSPKDYHRVHSPVSGSLNCARYIPGRLFSVNQQTTEAIPDLFAINERLVMEFDTEQGPVSVVMVGAMIVAGIQPVWRDEVYAPKIHQEDPMNIEFSAGDELGRFLMGSTAIVVSSTKLDFDHQAGDIVQMGISLVSEKP